jgi:hypothetical protein
MKLSFPYKIIIILLSLIIITALFILYKYYSRVEEGFEQSNTRDFNVIFAGTVRNCEKYIKDVLNHIENCGKKFKNYAVVIYENDSNDNTRAILNDNKKSNYHYIFEDGITENRRTMRLANGRNKVLDKINQLNSDTHYDYLIVLDMDDINYSGTFVDSIDSCFKYNLNDWDVLSGNQTGQYYDIWALRKRDVIDYDFMRERKTADTKKNAEIEHILGHTHFDKNGLLEVDSAFGGIAIYKLSAIQQCRYVGEYYDDGSENCEHVEFHKCIKKNGGKLFINTEFYTS